MSAPTSPNPTFDPAAPMTPKWRSDIAWRLANGWSWKELAETLKCDADELRFATETDPEFAKVQEAAWARVTFDAEADAMRRLRIVSNSGEGERSDHACEVLAQYAAEHRDNDTRLAIEHERAKTRIEVEKLKTERALAKEGAKKAEDAGGSLPPAPVQPAPETEAERQKRFAREHAERAAEPEACVYIWGGKHPLGRNIDPDASDVRVRVKADRSRGLGASKTVYWVVPEPQPLAAAMPGEPGAIEAFAKCWPAA